MAATLTQAPNNKTALRGNASQLSQACSDRL